MTLCAKVIVGFMANVGNVFYPTFTNVFFLNFLHVFTFLTFFLKFSSQRFTSMMHYKKSTFYLVTYLLSCLQYSMLGAIAKLT